MATKLGAIHIETIPAAKIREVVLSGTVTLSGLGAVRDIVVFRNDDYSSLMGQTTSDTSGDFSVTVRGGSSDTVSLICIGSNASENSTIFSNISLA